MSGTVSAKSLIGEPKKKRAISPLAGKLAPKEMLVDVVRLEREYFERWPDAADPNQLVNFGPSGHRGSPLDGTFTEAHM
jgi:phosphoglucomutase